MFSVKHGFGGFPPPGRISIAATWEAASVTGLAVLLSLVFLPCAFAQSYWIDRVAGNPSAVDDGIPARDASLDNPVGVAVDRSGNLYIADEHDHRIRKVDAAGTITTVAGTGNAGFSGDGGPATNAQFYYPRGVAVDGAGSLYIADFWNHRIRRVDGAGTITTVAGTGSRGFSGDGGPAADAQLNLPSGVAVDGAGSLYIADFWNHRIRRVDAAGTITTVAGTGNAGFSGDGGPAANAQLRYPETVAVDGAGSLYIAYRWNHRIRKVDAAGTITTVAGTGSRGFSGDGGPAADAQLNLPSGVAVDRAGSLYIADHWNSRIRKVDAAGTITTVAGSGSYGFGGDCGPVADGELGFPEAIALDRTGQLVVASGRSRTVRRLSVTAPSRCRASPTTLPDWTVSRGRVEFGGLSSRGCLTLNAPVNGASYLVHTSEWQRRAPSSSAWATVGGTLRTGQLCAFEPTEPGQYRAVAEISVGSRARAAYRSANEISGSYVPADTEPTFGTASISDQSYISGTAISPLTLPAASGGDSPISYSLQPTVPGLSFDTQARRLTGTPRRAGTYSMRFSVRDSDGDTATLLFTITVRSSGASGGARRYGVDDVITTLPTGFWTPDVTSGGSFQYSAGTATVRLNNGGYIEEGDYRYTCASSGGCEFVNGTVTKGVVAESATGGSSTGDQPESADLVVGPPTVSDSSPDTGERFTLRAIVRNDGAGDAAATTLKYYRSSNSTISSRDTEVGTDSVPRLAAAATSAESIRLTAPSSEGTYYYGACVEAVANESDTANNCSSSVALAVADSGGGTPPTSPSGAEYTPLEGWTVSSGRVRFLFVSAGRCVQLRNTTINGVTYTIHSSKWQRRANSASAWADIPGTAANGSVCSYSPTESGQYRGVAEISIGGTRRRYATNNVLTVP